MDPKREFAATVGQEKAMQVEVDLSTYRPGQDGMEGGCDK
jgi:hypothetical protein